MTVAVFNAAPGLLLPLALAPRDASILDLLFSLDYYRPLFAYWFTVFGAGAFTLSCVLAFQGIAVQLPRRAFLRISAGLQMITLCVLVCGYFLQPSLASPRAILAPQSQHLLVWLPSYWFFGLFLELNGSLAGAVRAPVFALASRAWAGLAASVMIASAVFLLAYWRNLQKIVEEPDIAAAARSQTWLPHFGNSIATAVTQFSIRTLLRSRQHRIILSFYAGAGFAIIILFLKTAVARQLAARWGNSSWPQLTLPVLASSFVMMCAWILGIRVVFAIPLELRANWIFRVTLRHPARDYVTASRRAMYVLALGPVCMISAFLVFSLWPWRPALQHVMVLTLVSVSIIEFCLSSFPKIPFTCSYLPGKSNLHVTFCLCGMLGLDLIWWSADFERRALTNPIRYAEVIAVLCVAAFSARWRTTRAISQCERLQFQEEASPAITSLGLHRDGVLPLAR